MRTEFINQFTELNTMELENLTKETKESVAANVQVENSKLVFTAANLWNIHNMRRIRIPGRVFVS